MEASSDLCLFVCLINEYKNNRLINIVAKTVLDTSEFGKIKL